MLTRILASRFAGYILMALAGLALTGGLFGGIQTYRLNNAKALVETQKTTIETLEDRVRSDAAAIKQRDLLIAKQNAAVDNLVKQAAKDRAVYLANYAKVDERAKDNDVRAAQLMKLTASTTDELAQCREARELLEQELTQ